MSDASGFRIQPYRGGWKLTACYASDLATAEHKVAMALWPKASRQRQLSDYLAGEKGEHRPRVCAIDRDHAAHRVEVYFRGHLLGTYTIDDLPGAHHADPSTHLARKLERELERIRDLPSKPRGAKKQEAYDLIALAMLDNPKGASDLFDKLVPYLK